MRESSGVAAGLTSLPSGGGGAAPLGDRFEPDLVRGSGSYTVPINCPKGPLDLQPTLALTYSTGSGNGPFGLGWRLGVLRIERQSDRGIPSYTDADTFVIANAEELVPVGGGRYRPHVDTKGWLIERLDRGWRIRTGDGRTMLVGITADGRESDGARDHAWCLEEERDLAGNRIQYTYRRDGGCLYLAEVRYSIFAVRFVYEVRPDVLRNGRSGFARVTALRGTAIELHCDRVAPTLMRTYAFTFAQAQNGASLLSRVRLSAIADGETAAFPELAFDYTTIDFDTWQVHEPEAMVAPPSLDDSSTQLVDMTGDALPDVLQSAGSHMWLWRNTGAGSFEGPSVVDGVPSIVSLGRHNVAFADLDGNGRVDLFAVDQPLQLAFQANGAGGFHPDPVIFRDRPHLRLSAGDTRLMDVDGDGVTDLITTGRQSLLLYPHKPGVGWQEPEAVARIADLEQFPDVTFGDRGVQLGDMTGDGLQDFVAIQSGNVCYWPYFGHGVWGRRVDMDRPPVFPPGYREDRLHVVDLDGDGCADIVYLDSDRTIIWLNQSGSGFAAPIELPIALAGTARVLAADLFGDGRDGFVWTSTATRQDSSGYRFLRFDGGQMPYLMRTVRNGMGKTIETAYTTSTAMRLADRDAGRPWPGQLPFVIPVVATIHEQDAVTGAETRLALHYHDGVYDGPRREFRGFSAVTMEMDGDESMPASRQEHEFFQGDPDEVDLVKRERERALSGSMHRMRAFERAGDAFVLRHQSSHTWDLRLEFSGGDRRVLFPFLAQTETREFSSALDPARVERISMLDYTVHGSVARRIRECFAEGAPPADIIRTEERTAFTTNEEAWLVKLPVRQETRDGSGVPFSVVVNFYDGPAFEGLPEGHVAQGLITRTRELALLESRLPADYIGARDFTTLGYHVMGAGDARGFYATTLAVKRDARGNVIEQRDPAGTPFVTAYDVDGVYPALTTDARGRTTTFVFDPRSGDPARIQMPDGRALRSEYDAIGRLIAHFVADDAGDEQLLTRWVVDTVSIPNSTTSYAPRQGGRRIDDFTAATDPAGPVDAAVSRTYYDGSGSRAQQVATAAAGPAGVRRFASSQTQRNPRKVTKVAHATAFVPDFAFTPPPPPDESSIRYRHDARGNVIETVGPGPAQFRVVRDTFTLRHHEGDSAGVFGADTTPFPPTRIEHFDARDRVVRIDEARGDGAFISVQYDLTIDGRIEALKDADGREVARYTFAGPGGPLRISHRDAGTRTYYRDAAGRVAELVCADGARLFYTYDQAGLLVRMEHASAGSHVRSTLREYFYDRDPDRPAEDRFLSGRIALIREPRASYRYAYNRAGFSIREEVTVEATTLVTAREFDFQGSLAATIYPDGRRLESRRDASGAIQQIPGVVSSIAYDADGTVEGYTFVNGVEVSLPREAGSRRLQRIVARKGAATLRSLDYGYDTIGNITALHDEIAGNIEHQTFTYDGLYRLTHFETRRDRAAGAVLRAGTYAYDDEGNLQQLEEARPLRFEYGDAQHRGRLTRVRDGAASDPVTYDACGHVAATAGMTIAFDALGRVVNVSRADGIDIELLCDPQNRRLVKRVTTGNAVQRVLYASHLYEQHDDHAVRHVYLSNQLVASERVAGNAGASTTTFFVSDHHGTTVLATDGDGAIVQQQRYSPFGLASNLSALDRYLGHDRDIETGFLHLGMRCYAPQVGRFLSPDWFVLENPDKPMRMPQGFNVYSYSLNNPLVFKDPSGKWFFLPFLVGFVAGLIYGAADGRSGDATWSLAKETALTVGVGVWGGWCTGMFLGGPLLGMFGGFMGGLNGLFAGTRQIYDDIQFGGAEGWASLISDSTWGLIGTSIGNALNVVNLISAPSSYRSDFSKGQNRQVYDRGFAFGNTALTQGNVISNLDRGTPGGGVDKMKILKHETTHVMQNRIFGPVFTVTYVAWFAIGGAVGLGIALFSGQDAGDALIEVGHDDNPFELWAYEIGGEGRNKGKLSL